MSVVVAVKKDDTIKTVIGIISYCGGKNILEMSNSELQQFRSQVAYVPQADDYINIGKKLMVLML